MLFLQIGEGRNIKIEEYLKNHTYNYHSKRTQSSNKKKEFFFNYFFRFVFDSLKFFSVVDEEHDFFLVFSSVN